jgi:hypothetical protein
MGFPRHVGVDRPSRIGYLVSCGATPDVAEWLCEYIDKHGTAFEQMGIDPRVTALVRELHCMAWFQYQGCADYVYTMTGGRQGCKLGGIVFNSAYALVLIALRSRLKSQGITFKLRRRTSAFWHADAPFSADEEDIIDVAFVDDLCVVLTATSPKLLWKASHELLLIIMELFKCFRLSVNWNKGKTEALVKFRGKMATTFYGKLRTSEGFGMHVPGSDASCTSFRAIST